MQNWYRRASWFLDESFSKGIGLGVDNFGTTAMADSTYLPSLPPLPSSRASLVYLRTCTITGDHSK